MSHILYNIHNEYTVHVVSCFREDRRLEGYPYLTTARALDAFRNGNIFQHCRIYKDVLKDLLLQQN